MVKEGYYVRSSDMTLSGLVLVRSVTDTEVIFHPAGGGFEYHAPIADFEAIHVVADPDLLSKMAGDYKLTKFMGDWFPEGAKPMVGFTNGERWNGWAIPLFQREEIIAAMADGRLGSGNLMPMQYLVEEDAFVIINCTDDGGGWMELPKDYDIKSLVKEALANEHGYAEQDTHPDVDVAVQVHRGSMIKTPIGEIKAFWIGDGWCWYEYQEDAVAA